MVLRGKPKRNDSYVPTGRIWPSGDFSVGFRRVAGDRAARVDLRNTRQLIDDGDMALPSDRWEYGRYGAPKLVEPLGPGERWADHDAWAVGDDGAATPLTLANVPNSHTRRSRPSRYGKSGMTGYGKRMVKSVATLVQKRFTAARTTFCTISMPKLPADLRRELARCWPEMLRQLLQWISRRLEKRGLPPVVVSVSEIQPKRLKGYGEAYLHLHLVWGNHWAKAGNWALDAREIRSWVERFLSKRGIWIDGCWARVNVQPVKKSAAAYLAKYMSKGSDDIAAMAADLGWDSIPSQWWNMTKAARDWVKDELAQGDDVGSLLLASVDAIFSGVVPFRDAFHSLHEVMLDIDGRPRGVGWRGALVDAYRKELLRLLDTQSLAS